MTKTRSKPFGATPFATRTMLSCAAAIMLSNASPAVAAFVVDTGTPVPGAPDYGLVPGMDLATQFTLGSATTINSVEGYINGSGGSAGTITIYGNGNVPAAANALFTAAFTTVLAPSPGAWQGVFGKSWNLAAGTYWVGFGSTGADGMVGGAPNPLPAHAFTSSGIWFRTSPLNIGVRIAGVPGGGSGPGPVPEPATWAMMIAGFGAIGVALRRRQRVRFRFRFA